MSTETTGGVGGIDHIPVGSLVALAAIVRVPSPMPHRPSYGMERAQTAVPAEASADD